MEYDEIITIPFGTKILVKAYRHKESGQIGFYDTYDNEYVGESSAYETVQVDTVYLGYGKYSTTVLVENPYNGCELHNHAEYVISENTKKGILVWRLESRFVVGMVKPSIKYGHSCIECKTYNEYAVANYGDQHICFSCRKTYMWKHTNHAIG